MKRQKNISSQDKIYIGTSGFSYSDWKERFYPKGLNPRDWLRFYAQNFNTVELNVTFYRQVKPKVFENWYKNTPKDFVFVVKGSRFITHIKRLKSVKEPIKRFFNNIKGLREKLGVILWQFPPSFKKDKENVKRLKQFIKLLSKKYLHTLEFRDDSWFCEEIYDILKENNIGIVLADYPYKLKIEGERLKNQKEKNIIFIPITANFLYIRKHGPGKLFASRYSLGELKKLASEIKEIMGKVEKIFVFFNNDYEGYALTNASQLKKLIKK